MTSLTSRLFRASAFQLMGNVVKVVAGVIASALLVRWLGTEEFGKASFVVSLVLYVSVLASAGVGIPYVTLLTGYRMDQDRHAVSQLIRNLFRIRLVTGIIVTVLWGLAQFLPEGWMGSAATQDLLIFIPLLIIVSYLHGASMRTLIVHYDHGFVAGVTAAEILLKLGVTLLLAGGATPTAADLLYAAVISETIASICFAARARLSFGVQVSLRSTEVPGARQLLHMARHPYLLGMAVRVLDRDVDVILIGLLAGPTEVVRYVLPFSLATVAASLVGSALHSTTSLTAFRELSTDEGGERSSRLLRSMVEFWLLFQVPLAVGGAFVGNELLQLLYGNSAEGLGRVTALIFAAVTLNALAGTFKDVLQGHGRDRGAAGAYLTGGAVNLALSLAWIPSHGAEGAAAATCAGTLVLLVVEGILLSRTMRLGVALRSGAVVAAGLACMIAVLVFGRSELGGVALVPRVLAQVGLGAVCYLAVLIALQPRSSLRDAVLDAQPRLRHAARIL